MFTSKTLTLTEGNHISSNDVGKALISKDLAERNQLKVGDQITTQSTTKKEIKLQIAGLFTAAKTEDVTEMVTSYDKIQNRIFTDLDTAVRIEDSPAVHGFNGIRVTVDDPQNMKEIIANVKASASLDWKAFRINVNDEVYQRAVQPLMALRDLMITMLLVIIVASAIILALILTLWTKSRVHEIGVFLSVGIKKTSIFAQYLMEVFMIAVIAFGLSYLTSNVIANEIGKQLLQRSAYEESRVPQDDITADNAGVAVLGEHDALLKEDTSMEVSVGADSLVQLYLIGSAVIMFAVGVSSVTIMRLKPREILSKMS